MGPGSPRSLASGAHSRDPLACPGRRKANVSFKRLQSRFDLRAARLEERRQSEFLAELLHRLVAGKAGTVGGDLEQDAVRLAEIEAAEIEAVDLAAVGDAQLVEPRGPGMILRLVRRAEGDVMHAAGALARGRQVLAFDHMQFGR